jgi:hypothetical protein
MSRKRRKPEKIVAKLRRLGRRRLSVWPRYPQQDPAAQRHITDLVKAGTLFDRIERLPSGDYGSLTN